MRVALFGATGMVGQGVLRECLRDERVEAVPAVAAAGYERPILENADITVLARRDRPAGS